jgi:chromosome segregation ATPase
MAETLDRFTERVAVLTKAVDGLRSQLEERSRQVESLSTDLSVGLNSLQEAAEEVGRVRAVLAAQPTDELERQMSELIGEVKATRRSVAVSSTKKKTLDNDAVERIVRSVVERLTETRPAPKTNRSRRSSVAG